MAQPSELTPEALAKLGKLEAEMEQQKAVVRTSKVHLQSI
jgi:hypothetical protein